MSKQQLGLAPALTLDLVSKGYVDTAIAGVGSGGAGTPFGSTTVDNGDGTTTTTTVQLLDASTTAKGLIQLAGDLAGTAASPTVNAVVANTNNSIVRRDSAGGIAASYVYNLGAPTTSDGAANKGYVDARTPKITVSTTAPASPATGDLWVDTN